MGKDLVPWKHFVPDKIFILVLLVLITFLILHDAMSQAIAKAGQEYARANLSAHAIECHAMQTLHFLADVRQVPFFPEALLVPVPHVPLSMCSKRNFKVLSE